METARAFPLIFLSVLFASPTPVSGCGGWWEEEPPHSLASDLDRLPAKTLGQILLETGGISRDEPPFPVSQDEIALVASKVGRNANMLAAGIDRLVLRARANYDRNGPMLNTLYDIRDAITAPGPTDEQKKAYAEWRATHDPAAETTLPPEDFAKGDPMRPHKLYLEGAARFAAGDRKECVPWFKEIVKEFPDHPRAETARFLLARCGLWAARYSGEPIPPGENPTQVAVDAYRDYLMRYPHGRYAADAHGWLGGLLWDDDLAESLENYILQFEDETHPECAKSAAHMIEQALARVMADPERDNTAIFAVVARHPRIAQAAVYFVLNAPGINPYDGKYDEPAALKAWKNKVLPMLATAISAERARYDGRWDPRVRAMLAQAASATGDQRTALDLTAPRPGDLPLNDDIAFARMVALQRVGNAGKAIDAATAFLRLYPGSPLREGVQIRLAQALVDDHRAGEALLELCRASFQENDRWHGKNDTFYPPGGAEMALAASSVYPDTGGTDAATGLKSTILNLAPMPELEAVLARVEWSAFPEELAKLRAMLARRKIANEDFAAAEDFADEPDLQKRIADFQPLLLATTTGDPADKARAMVALGDAFESQAIANLDEPKVYERAEANLELRENARALGFPEPEKELDDRNPLRHATRWWLRAARLVPGTDLSAAARAKVLKGMENTALVSDYDFTRAMESDISAASREIYEVLRKESPQSAEARGAAWLSFEPWKKTADKDEPGKWGGMTSNPWDPQWTIRGREDLSREVEHASLLGGYRWLPYDAFGDFQPLREHDVPANEVTSPILLELNEIDLAANDLSQRFSAERVTRDFKNAQAAAENAAQVKTANLFEDLMLFQRVPALSDEARNKYIRLRLRADEYPLYRSWNGKPDTRPSLAGVFETARANPALATVQDFIDYAGLYANEADRGPIGEMEPIYPTYREVEKGCRGFLAKYPASPRREACWLLLMRAIYRQLPERFGHAVLEDGTIDTGSLVESHEDFRQGRLEEAIAAYQAEFPSPRYAAEVENFNGIIAWRKYEYGPALDLTIRRLDDPDHRDLRREAAVRLANIPADLADPLHRVAAMDAISKSPAAREKLRLYLAIAPLHRDHPLRCLTGFIGEQLAGK